MPQDRASEDTIVTVTELEALQSTELTLHTTTALLSPPPPQEYELVKDKTSKFLSLFSSLSSLSVLSASSSKFRTAVFGWCCLGYVPEPQLQRSLGNQASDIFHFCNGRAHAPPRLMRWEIPKQREEFQMVWNKK